MCDSLVGKVLCLAALPLAGLSHVCMLYGGIPYPVVGAIAAGTGLAGLVVASTWGKRRRDGRVSVVYVVLAVIGLLAGTFYASVIGPLIVFFPRI